MTDTKFISILGIVDSPVCAGSADHGGCTNYEINNAPTSYYGIYKPVLQFN